MSESAYLEERINQLEWEVELLKSDKLQLAAENEELRRIIEDYKRYPKDSSSSLSQRTVKP